MITSSIKIEGGKELERRLAELESKVGKKIIRQAVRNSHKIMLAAAKSRAVSLVGGTMGKLLASNLVLRATRRQRRGSYEMQVRTRSESEGAPAEFTHITRDGTQHYVPAAIEFGHGSNKEQSARPFMRQAADATQGQVMSRFIQLLRQGISQAAENKRSKP